MFFLAVVGAPALRGLESAELRARLFHALGMRFRRWGWISIGTLVVTGVWILQVHGVLRWQVLSDPAWWDSPFGRALFWKLVAVGVIIGLAALHDFVFGPMASLAAGVREGGPAERDPVRAARARRRAALLARVTGVVGLVLVDWAVRLARGG